MAAAAILDFRYTGLGYRWWLQMKMFLFYSMHCSLVIAIHFHVSSHVIYTILVLFIVMAAILDRDAILTNLE